MKEKRKRLALGMSIVMLVGFGMNTFGTWAVFGASSFRDVKEGQWFESFVRELSEEGIIGGYPDGTFQPDKALTRAELAKVIDEVLKDIDEKIKRLDEK